MKGITYRPATKDDLEAMTRVGVRLFDHEIKPDRAIEFFADRNSLMVLAWHDDTVVGMASGLVYVHPDKDPALFINEVSVVEEFRSMGIGRALVAFALEEGKRRNCRDAWLATEESNTAAIRCYEKAEGNLDPEKAVVFTWSLE